MTLMACVQIPHFAIAVAQRTGLADGPLILYTSRPRASVYAAAPETSVEAGLPLRQAMLATSHAVCRLATPKQDQTVFAMLIALLQTFSPRVEAGDLLPNATIECDLGRRTLPQAMILTERIATAIRRQLQLLPALGFARNRFVARAAAATAGPGTAIVVPPGYEATFLAPLPTGLLPLDAETARRLALFGLRTIGAVAALPIDALQVQFGGYGRVIHQLSNGIDAQPIGANEPATHIEVSRRFDGPLAQRQLLELVLRELAAELAVSLTTDGWAARDIMLTFTLADGAPWTARRVLTEATSDEQVLSQALIALLGQAVLVTGIEAIRVQVTDLSCTVAAQLELFAPEQGKADRLRSVLQRLSTRYSGCFVQAKLAEPDAYVPEQRVQFTTLAP